MPASARVESRKLVADLRAIPVELRRELRRELRAAGAPIVADAKSRAAWSSRIPGAIGLRTSASGRGLAATIRVRAARAPHARPIENQGRHGTFRHPVFGNRDRWVPQRARPFLDPAARAGFSRFVQATGKAVETAARRHGFN